MKSVHHVSAASLDEALLGRGPHACRLDGNGNSALALYTCLHGLAQTCTQRCTRFAHLHTHLCTHARLCPAVTRACTPRGSSIIGSSSQEFWRGLPFPPQGILPSPGIDAASHTRLHWQVGPLPLNRLGSPRRHLCPRRHVPPPGRHSEAGRASAVSTWEAQPSLLTDPLKPPWPCPRPEGPPRPTSVSGGAGASWAPLWLSGPCFPEPSGQAASAIDANPSPFN